MSISKNDDMKHKHTKKFTKADIGFPTDFKHIAHAGWPGRPPFDLNDIPKNQTNIKGKEKHYSTSIMLPIETQNYVLC